MPKNTGLDPRTTLGDNFPHWEKPNPVGFFSLNSERIYQGNLENLHYLKLPQRNDLPLDLNAGIESVKRKPENARDEALDNLLRYILDNYENLSASLNKKTPKPANCKKNPLFPVEFVCWRGLLRLIMCTPFERSNDWLIHITRFKGTHYFCQRETEKAKRDRLNETSLQKRMCSWGFKFEQYCLTKSPEIKPNTNAPVDECAEFGCIFNTRIEDCNLLYGAEMDGIKSEKPVHMNNDFSLADLKFIELKTSIQILHERQMNSFLTYKTRNWWCQAFLVGIEDIIVGWRDNDGFVHKLEELKINELYKQRKFWSPNVCARFLVSFLKCIKSLMSKVDCPYTVYEFRFDCRNSLITYDIYEGSTEKTFLTDNYIHFMEKLSNREHD